MKYLYHDLGSQQEGSWVVAHLRGSAGNVLVLDSENFRRYRCCRPFLYVGGLSRRTPTLRQIPRDGHWYLVVDCGGYTHRVYVDKVEVVTSEDSPPATGAETTLVGASAS